MKKDQENRTQSKIYSVEAQISSLSSFHLHIICGSQSMSDMAHMWRTVIRVFLLLLSWGLGIQGRQRLFVLSRTIRLLCPIISRPGKRIKNIKFSQPSCHKDIDHQNYTPQIKTILENKPTINLPQPSSIKMCL